MNRFVIVMFEEYDDSGWDVPYPVETPLTREELLAEVRAAYDSLPEDTRYPHVSGRKAAPNGRWHEDPGGGRSFRQDPVYTAGLVRMYVGDLHEFEDRWPDGKALDSGPRYVYRHRPPTVLTLDEWYTTGRFRR